MKRGRLAGMVGLVALATACGGSGDRSPAASSSPAASRVGDEKPNDVATTCRQLLVIGPGDVETMRAMARDAEPSMGPLLEQLAVAYETRKLDSAVAPSAALGEQCRAAGVPLDS